MIMPLGATTGGWTTGGWTTGGWTTGGWTTGAGMAWWTEPAAFGSLPKNVWTPGPSVPVIDHQPLSKRRTKRVSKLTSLDKDISTSPAHEAWLIREPAWAKISVHTLLLIAVRIWAVFLVGYWVDVEFHTTSNEC